MELLLSIYRVYPGILVINENKKHHLGLSQCIIFILGDNSHFGQSQVSQFFMYCRLVELPF